MSTNSQIAFSPLGKTIVVIPVAGTANAVTAVVESYKAAQAAQGI